MTDTSIKPQLIDLLKAGRAIEQQWLAELSPADRSAVGAADQWAAKDYFAHMFYWRSQTAARLAAALDGSTPVDTEDFERLNQENFEAQRDRSWAELIEQEESTHQKLIDLIGKILEEDLTATNRFAWQRGSLLRSVIGNGYEHPMLHVAQLVAAANQLPRASQIQEEVTAHLMQFPEMRGAARYNLACFYALNGQTQLALVELREALQISPDLRDWSQKDSDLISLHGHPDYEALYA